MGKDDGVLDYCNMGKDGVFFLNIAQVEFFFEQLPHSGLSIIYKDQ